MCVYIGCKSERAPYIELKANKYANMLGMHTAALFTKVNYSYRLDFQKEKEKKQENKGTSQ